MPQRENLAKITIITDDDTGMYSIGEIDGGFNTMTLQNHIRKYGADGILKELNTMIYTVVGLAVNIKNESAGGALCGDTKASSDT